MNKLQLKVSCLVLVLFVGILLAFLWAVDYSTTQSQTQELYVAQPFKPTDLEVSFVAATSAATIQPAWQAFAQGGEEPGVDMLKHVVEDMSLTQPRYIRLDHIFDDDYYGVVKSITQRELDFSQLDATVASIQAMGAVPFFSLGYMPSEMADTKISHPYDWQDWQWLVHETIMHYSGRKQISDIYYEVWNEPDLESFGYWKYFGEKNYLTMYEYAAIAARQARLEDTQNFFFGGPATTALYRNWVLAVVRLAQSNDLPLDFISWHRYSYYPEQFRADIESVNSWLGQDHGYQLVISEWGPDPSKTSYYDSVNAAAHAVAVSRELIEGVTWAFAFEVKDGPYQEDFGWGLLRHNNEHFLPKPRFHAFSFLQNMDRGQKVEVDGEGSSISAWAVTTLHDLTIAMVNFDPTRAATHTVPVTIRDIPQGYYRFQFATFEGKYQEEEVLIKDEIGEMSQSFVLEPNDIAQMRLSYIKEYTSYLEGIDTDEGFGRLLVE